MIGCYSALGNILLVFDHNVQKKKTLEKLSSVKAY